MKELNIQDIRNIQIDLLNHLDKFCKENGIQYFLSNGSALGAIKYKGYIPWDDDIDVCLLRPDYDMLLKKYPLNNFNPVYELFSLETSEDYLFPFAKLSYAHTLLIENNVNNGVQLGVNIDIFPIDGYGASIQEAVLLRKKMEIYRKKLNWSKMDLSNSKLSLKNCAKRLISGYYKVIGARNYVKKMDSISRKHSSDESLLGNVVWGFYGTNEAHSRDTFSDAVVVQFENGYYPVPIKFDAYLTKLYGDYRLDPPIEKQVTHHNFNAFFR